MKPANEPTDPGQVTLRAITADTVRSIIKLSVAPSQEQFVAPNVYSLAQALFAPEAWYRAIYLEDEPAGFVMLADDHQLPEPKEKPELWLWRFMVDEKFQGRGVGSAALRLVIDHARSLGSHKVLSTSYVPGEGSPERLYLRAGFEHTGRMDEDEIVLDLHLVS